jgi:uncharacterized alpha-E superfamily protein
MLSRVAERVYWFARYIERIENTARLMNVHTALLMDLPEQMEINWFTPVTLFNAEDLYFELHDSVDEYSVAHFLLAEPNYSASLMNSLASARENARTTIDILPDVLWEQVNELYLLVKSEMSSIGNRRRRQQLLLKIIEICQSIWGMVANHMSRNHAYYFMSVGMHLERADMTSRILELTSLLVSDTRSEMLRKYEGIVWTNLLTALSARQMYIQTESPAINVESVLGFLINDMSFPRSLAFSLESIAECLNKLPQCERSQTLQQQLNANLHALTQQSLPVDIIHTHMDELQTGLNKLNQEMGTSWFYPDYTTQ